MQVRGRVVKGEGKAGGYYGVPTANLHLEASTHHEPGVYAGEVILPNGEHHPCVICHGAGLDSHGRPKFEIHLFGWQGDLYDQTVQVRFKARVSDLAPFKNEEQMRKKILEDVAEAKRILGIT